MGAIERRETRGCHVRVDYPELDPALQVNTVITREADGHLVVTTEPVPPMSDQLRAWVEETDALEVAGRLLE